MKAVSTHHTERAMTEENITARETFAGSLIEIDGAGDYLIDTREAIGGDLHIKLAAGRSVSIEIGGRLAFEVSTSGSQVLVDIGGNATERLVLGDRLMTLLNTFFAKYDVHTHPTAMGPSGPPLPLFTGTTMTPDQLSDVARTKKT